MENISYYIDENKLKSLNSIDGNKETPGDININGENMDIQDRKHDIESSHNHKRKKARKVTDLIGENDEDNDDHSNDDNNGETGVIIANESELIDPLKPMLYDIKMESDIINVVELDKNELNGSMNVINNNRDDWINWNTNDVIHWIISLNIKKYQKYETKLRIEMNKQGFNGKQLRDLVSHYNGAKTFKQFGITNINDMLNIAENINQLLEEQSSDDNDNDYDIN